MPTGWAEAADVGRGLNRRKLRRRLGGREEQQPGYGGRQLETDSNACGILRWTHRGFVQKLFHAGTVRLSSV